MVAVGGGGGLVHPLGDARVVDIGETVGGAAPDLGDVPDDLLGHGTPPPLPQARPEQQEEALRGKKFVYLQIRTLLLKMAKLTIY